MNPGGFSGRDFTFFVPLSKSREEPTGSVILEGIASTTAVDYQNERITLRCLKTMESQIREKGMNLFLDHQHTIDKIAGIITDCKVDSDKLIVQARTTGTPNGLLLAQLAKDGVKIGLSVGGKIRVAEQGYDAKTGKNIANIDDVILHEISAVGIAANPETSVTGWIAKSLFPSGAKEQAPFSDLKAGAPAFDLLKLGRRPTRFPDKGSLRTGVKFGGESEKQWGRPSQFSAPGMETPESDSKFTQKISRERNLYRLGKGLALLGLVKSRETLIQDYPFPLAPGPWNRRAKEDLDALPPSVVRELIRLRGERLGKSFSFYRRFPRPVLGFKRKPHKRRRR